MRAATISHYNQPLEISNVPDPRCPPDGVIVEVKACGVCRSDWHGWNGTHPKVKTGDIPGHEFSGIVVETGPQCTRFSLGDRVTAPFILACGTCQACTHTSPTICDDQKVLGFGMAGAFAELLAVPRADFNLVALPEQFGFVEAAGMGCRLTTAHRALIDRARLKRGEWLAVHGCGGVGLSAILLAKTLGAKIIAVDINQAALKQAEELGADHLVDAKAHEDVGEFIRDLSDGGVQVSLDALGITQTFLNSLYSLAKLGRHIQIGMPIATHATPTLPLMDLVYLRQISILGTRGMAASAFPDLFELLLNNNISPAALVSHKISLEEASDALAGMTSGKTVGISVIDCF